MECLKSASGPQSKMITMNESKVFFYYSHHPKTRLILFSNGRFVSGCRMVRYSNGIRKPDEFVRFPKGKNKMAEKLIC